MKGFGIEIKNDLLDPKHVDRMGAAVWLYMWCLDKMTSISEGGIGLILGGKPIQYEDVVPDLGLKRSTYFRWMKDLEKGGYIVLERTPIGSRIAVNKAFKHFRPVVPKMGLAVSSPRNETRSPKNGTTSPKNEPSTITYTEDSTGDKDKGGVGFEEFWKIYPRKVEKKKAEQKWAKIQKKDRELIIADIPKRAVCDAWQRGFIPHPTTYLNGERWNDEIIKGPAGRVDAPAVHSV